MPHPRLLPLVLGLTLATAPLARPAEAPRVLLLGEVHDSAAGHAARAALLRKELEAGWRPAIAMEQFDTSQQPALDAAMRACADAACVVARVAPPKASWTWEYYQPVIALAGGSGKHVAIRAALNGRWINGLVTDEVCAQALLG